MGLLIDITALVFSLLIMLLSDSKEVLFLASLLAFINFRYVSKGLDYISNYVGDEYEQD